MDGLLSRDKGLEIPRTLGDETSDWLRTGDAAQESVANGGGNDDKADTSLIWGDGVKVGD